MAHELKDLADLLDKADGHRPGQGVPEPPTEEEVTRCIQVMLSRQCIYPFQHTLSRVYAILRWHGYQDFFRRYFATMGLELYHDTRSDMIALRFPGADKKRYDWQANRLKKDETLVLFVLKLAYEEGFKAQAMTVKGTVEITTDDLIDKLSVVGGVEIEETRLYSILEQFRRKGIVVLGERDPVERVRPLTVLPGIEVACPDAYMQQVSDWAGQMPPGETTEGDTDGPDGAAEAAGEEEDHAAV